MSFDDLLKSLQAEYLASIPGKVEVISKQTAQANIADIRESFHKLKGTGKTYGIPEISELSADVERICLSAPAHAVQASQLGLVVLQAIFAARTAGQEHPLAQDSNYLQIRKLLPA